MICPPVEAQMPETSTWVQERRICSILAHQACKTLVYVQITVGPCRRRRAQINRSGDFLYTYTSGDFWGSRSEAADARRLLFISKMRISSQSEPKFHMFHFWFPTDDSNTSLMYRSGEEKKKEKKTVIHRIYSLLRFCCEQILSDQLFFPSPTNKSEGKKYSRTHTVAPPEPGRYDISKKWFLHNSVSWLQNPC